MLYFLSSILDFGPGRLGIAMGAMGLSSMVMQMGLMHPLKRLLGIKKLLLLGLSAVRGEESLHQ